MVFYKKSSKLFQSSQGILGQTTIETLIIFSVSLLIITIILGIVFNQLEIQRNFEQTKLGETAVNILASEINDAYFLGPGTTKTVVVTIPELTNFRKSFIYQNNLVLNVAGTDISKSTATSVKGNWPSVSGSYSFRIVAFPDFVSLNSDILNFSPEKIQEKVSQSSEKNINLIITNNSNFVKDYTLSTISFNDEKATIFFDSVYDSFSVNPLNSITIPISLSCASDASGTYVGGINFVSDTTIAYPIVITCESSQEKLSIFPGVKNITSRTNLGVNQNFSVCNNSSNDLYVDAMVDGNLNLISSVSKNIFVQKNSCTLIDLNLLSSNPGVFSGRLKVSSAGFSSFANIDSNFYLPNIKYFFKSVSNNNLNNWFNFGNNITKRWFDDAWVASGEIDWNKDKNYLVHGSDWDQNLIAYYKFNDRNSTHIFDLVRGNDGNLVNDADLNSNGLWDSNAIDFNGVNQYVEVLDNSDLKITDKFSVFLWINSRNIDQLTQGLIGKYMDEKREWDLRISQEGISEPQGKISIQFGTDTGAYSGRWYSTQAHIVENEWMHIGFTFSSGVVKIYVNGVEVSSSLFNGVIPTSISNFDAPLTIGQDFEAYFDGLMDEVTIWDKNLSEEEILSLYNSQTTAKFVDKNIFDALEVVDWNAIKINSEFDYDFGETTGISSIDLNIYSCDDSFCNQKTSFNYLTDLNSGSFIPITINNSRYVGFDAYFKLIEKYSNYGDYVYAGSFFKDINLEYR